METRYSTKEELVARAKEIVGKSLRNLIPPAELDAVEAEVAGYGSNRKGLLGAYIEWYLFGKRADNRNEADFSIAGVELKTNPLRRHASKQYVSKERLVFSMIDYGKIVHEEWETSSFLAKNGMLLILFYLWVKDTSIIDYDFKFAHLLDLLGDISEEDLFQIRKDWEYIVAKIRRGEAHLLSEGDTYYLGACTKAAKSRILREQPVSRIPAKPRAFSFKQQYLNYIIQKSLLGKDASTESIFKKTRRIESVEDVFKERLVPYIGMTDKQIRDLVGWEAPTAAKNYKRLLVNKMLGVASNRIEELEKAAITLRVVTLEHTGTLRESISFPAFDYKELSTDLWYDEEAERMADFHAYLETKKFLFVVFRKERGSSSIRFEKAVFWNFPMSDLPEAERVWQKTVDCINEGRYDDMPKISDSRVAHVRPHGKNAQDVLKTPQGTREIKRSFWLNASYIQEAIERAA